MCTRIGEVQVHLKMDGEEITEVRTALPLRPSRFELHQCAFSRAYSCLRIYNPREESHSIESLFARYHATIRSIICDELARRGGVSPSLRANISVAAVTSRPSLRSEQPELDQNQQQRTITVGVRTVHANDDLDQVLRYWFADLKNDTTEDQRLYEGSGYSYDHFPFIDAHIYGNGWVRP